MYQLDFIYPILLLFVVGIVVSFICHKLRLPMALFLLLAGIILGKITLPAQLIDVPEPFVLGVSIFALIMVSYDVYSRLKPHRHESYEHNAIQVTAVFIGVVLLTLGAVFIAAPLTDDPITALLICCLMAGIAAPFYLIKSVRIKHFIDLEANLNEAIIIFLSALFIHFLVFRQRNPIIDSLNNYMLRFGLEILVGLGAGILLGLVVFKLFRKASRKMSPVALLATCIATYVFAELAGGAGIFGVISLALLYGGLTIKHKAELEEFSRTLSTAIETMVFLLLGLLVSIQTSWAFLGMSLAIFACVVAVRLFAVSLILRTQYFSWKERLATTLIAPKGVAVAVLALSAFFIGSSIFLLLQLLVAVILYSQLTAWMAHSIRT